MSEHRLVETQHPVQGSGLPAVSYSTRAGFPPGFGPGPASSTGTTQLRHYVNLLQRYWWIVLLAGVVGAAYQWWITRNDRPLFVASSAVRLEDQSASMGSNLVPDYSGGFAGYTDPILTEVQVIKSRIVADRVVDSLGLQLQSETPGFFMGAFRDIQVAPNAPLGTLDFHFSPSHFVVSTVRGPVIGDYGKPVTIGGVTFTMPHSVGFQAATLAIVPRQTAVDQVLADLAVKPRDMTSVIDISYTSTDPYIARDVASAVAKVFQSQNEASAREQAHSRRIFIESQLNTTDSLLAIAQARIVDYRRSNLTLSAQSKYTMEQTDLASANKQADTLRAMRASYETLQAALQRSEHGDPSALRTIAFAVGPAGNNSVSTLYDELMRYEHVRDSLTTGAFARTAAHPDVRRIDALITAVEPQLREAVTNQINTLSGELAAVDTIVRARTNAIAQIPASEETEQRLTRDADNILKMSDRLNDELQSARIAEAVQSGTVDIVDLAQYPAGSIGAGRKRRITYGVLLGLLLGFGLILLLDRLSSSVRRWEDLESMVHVPGLTLIPPITDEASETWSGRIRGAARKYLPTLMPRHGVGPHEVGSELVMVNDVRSASAESYRKLMTNLMYSSSQPGLHVVVVTSASAGEGKTTTVSNLAVAFAQQGRRTVLIDSDLRRARIHHVFALSLAPGLTDVLVGNASIEQGIHPSGVAGLSIIPAGTLPPNPLEFLGGERMRELLVSLRERFDVILIDTPPVLVTADAALMGVQADGVVMVVRAGKSDRVATRHAVEQIVALGGRMLGAVLNDPDARTPRHSRYGEEYYGYTASTG